MATPFTVGSRPALRARFNRRSAWRFRSVAQSSCCAVAHPILGAFRRTAVTLMPLSPASPVPRAELAVLVVANEGSDGNGNGNNSWVIDSGEDKKDTNSEKRRRKHL